MAALEYILAENLDLRIGAENLADGRESPLWENDDFEERNAMEGGKLELGLSFAVVLTKPKLIGAEKTAEKAIFGDVTLVWRKINKNSLKPEMRKNWGRRNITTTMASDSGM